jgi:uncharacterized protein
MSEKDLVLSAFLSQISGVRNRIQKIVLFGSRARGDEKPYSDYDILLVVEERERDLMEAIHDAVVEVLLSTGRLVSPKVFRRRDFEKYSQLPTPFFANILKEGISIG